MTKIIIVDYSLKNVIAILLIVIIPIYIWIVYTIVWSNRMPYVKMKNKLKTLTEKRVLLFYSSL